MFSLRPGAARTACACLAMVALAFLRPAAPQGLSPDVVISQVYGAGGNTGALYTHDYVELFNRGSAAVSLAGWSIQYASATGTGAFGNTATQITELPNVSLQPGQYYLVQQAGGAIGASLPLPDYVDPTPINMSGSAGKVALARIATTLGCNGGSAACSAAQLANIVDLLGYGGANFSETAPAAALASTTAAIRGDGGCTETDDNSADFSAAAPAPRTTASALKPCDGAPALSIEDVTLAEGDSGVAVAGFVVRLSAPAPTEGVSFNIATADGTATLANEDYESRTVTGATIPAGEQTYAFDVNVKGDGVIEPNESFSVSISAAAGAVLGRAQATGTITNDDVAPVTFDVVISQVYGGGGNSGATYTHDFVELFNRGATPVSLAGWSVQYNSAAGTGTWQATALSGSIAPGAYYLVQQGAGSAGTTPLPAPDASGGIAMAAASGKLLLRTTSAPASGACPVDASVVDLVGFGTATCFEGTAAAPVLSNTTAAQRRRGGCYDSNVNADDFTAGAPTPRNSASPVRACEYTTTTIAEIQGSGTVSPLAGRDVSTTGVVTTLKSNGFFLQSATGTEDGSALTSEAVFVFTGGLPSVSAGDIARVNGTATEFFSLTQIDASLPRDVTVTSAGHALPGAVALTAAMLDPAGPPDQLERFEGMRVHADALVAVAPTNEFGEIYAVLSGVPRPMREPGIETGTPVPPAAEGGQECCYPVWDLNPERIMIDTDARAGSTRLDVTSLVSLSGVTGPLDFSFGNYKILPEGAPSVSPNMSAIPVPVPTAGEFTVATFNIENFNNTELQRRKAALHLRTIMQSPDVVGVIEIASLPALQALAAQVNADATAAGAEDPMYEAFLVPVSGSTQNVGFLVKTSRVLVHAVQQRLADQTYTTPAGQRELLHDRPPLVLEATVAPASANPARIVVVVNHLRSFIGVEGLDAEGARVRAKRTAQAEAVAALLDELQEASAGAMVIAVGDLNAYQFSDGYTDPISVLKGQPRPGNEIVATGSPDLVDPDFINLTERLSPEQRYTFIFEGTPQALDHVLVDGVAARYVQRYAIARSNADFPELLATLAANPGTPERNSDHDSPVAYFAFPGSPVIQLQGDATLQHEAFTPFQDPGATARDDDGELLVTVSGAVNVNTPGSYVLTYTAANAHTSVSLTRIVNVIDSIAPAIAGFSMTPDVVRVPNHQFFPAVAGYAVTDASGAVSCALSVSSNEPPDGEGDGSTQTDWIIVNDRLLQLRAERRGGGPGRIYTVSLTCSDPSGNIATAKATVTVAR